MPSFLLTDNNSTTAFHVFQWNMSIQVRMIKAGEKESRKIRVKLNLAEIKPSKDLMPICTSSEYI